MTRPPIADVAATEVINIRVTPDLKARCSAEAARLGMSLSQWLIEAAELAIARGNTR